jgi:polysaccharide chain length determinant protein (PEP-CTERM system associated)
MIPGKVYMPEDVLRAALYRRWWIVIPFLVIGIASFLYSLSQPKRYRSETLILVVPQRIPESYVRSTVTAPIEGRLRSISEQILSRSRLEQVIKDFGLYVRQRELMPMEDVVEGMRQNISLTTVRGDSFRVTFSAGDPIVAMKITERLASMFIDENLRDREVQAEGTNQFLETQLEGARQRLLEHEKRLEKYRLEHSGELPSQSQANLQTVLGHRQQLQTVSESINRDRDRRLMLERTQAEISASEASQPAPDKPAAAPQQADSEQALDKARETLRTQLLRLKPDHPDVIATRRLVVQLERQVQDEAAAQPVASAAKPRAIPDAARIVRLKQVQAELDNIDRQIAAKEADAARLHKQIDEYQRRVDAAPMRETEMTELMRDYKTLQDVYVGLLEKKEASKLAANLERAQAGEQFKILDPARVPERPYSPDHVRTTAFGALAGLGFGLALALLLEMRDSTIRMEDDVVRLLALPVIAVVPQMHTAVDRRRFRRLLASIVVGVGLLAGLVAAGVAWQLGKLG